jgi:hypothetical protein
LSVLVKTLFRQDSPVLHNSVLLPELWVMIYPLLRLGSLIHSLTAKLKQGVAALAKKLSQVDTDRCPECKAWVGAWRGATWHDDGCSFEEVL